MVAVEDDHDRRGGSAERVVEVASLCAVVFRPGDVAGTVPAGQRGHLRVVPVVQQEHAHLRAPQPDRRGHRRFHHVDRLVVDRYQYVHGDYLSVDLWPAPAYALPGAGPPEAQRLHRIECLGEQQEGVKERVADPPGRQQPAEVPAEGEHVQRQQIQHPAPQRPARPHRLPRRRREPRVPDDPGSDAGSEIEIGVDPRVDGDRVARRRGHRRQVAAVREGLPARREGHCSSQTVT